MGVFGDLFGPKLTADARLTIAQGASEGVCRSVWARYIAYRQAGYLTPFSVRKTPYKQKIFSMGTHIIKEYTGARSTVEKEMAILQQLHHPHLVSFLFIADQGSRISIFMDWAGENLREHRTVTQPKQYNEDVARYMMYQLTSALAYLHSKGIIHRDIKPDNIAVRKDHSVQLFDWGEALCLRQLAGLSDRELARQVGIAGTPLFMPPEVLNYLTDRHRASGPAAAGCRNAELRELISTKLDVWGLGAVLFFLLAGRDIFLSDSEWELDSLADIANASTGVELPEGVGASYAARDFLRACLQRDPQRRASARELAEHPWLFGAHSYADMVAASEAAAAAAVAASLEDADSESPVCFRQQQAPAGVQVFQLRQAAAAAAAVAAASAADAPPGSTSSTALSAGRSLTGRPGQLSVLAESPSCEGDDAAAVASNQHHTDPLTASLALASGVAGLHLTSNTTPALLSLEQTQALSQLQLQLQPAAAPQQQQQQQQQQHSGAAGSLRRRGSHSRMESYGSCKSLVAIEEDAAAQLQRAADGEAVCEVRLCVSQSNASLASLNSLVTSAA